MNVVLLVSLDQQPPVALLGTWQPGEGVPVPFASVPLPRATAEQLHELTLKAHTQRGQLALSQVEGDALHLAFHGSPTEPHFAQHTLSVPPWVVDLLKKILLEAGAAVLQHVGE